MHPKVTIITHNGSFHTDDVFAVATILLVLKEKPVVARIVRTREQALVDSGDFVIDVGTVYDENRERYDHHQIGGAGERQSGVPYAAFGLVWKKYGKMLCTSGEVAQRIDKSLVQYIDAMDNGLGELKPVFGDVLPYSLREIIGASNLTWEEETSDQDARFGEAVNFALQILTREIRTTESLMKGESLVKEAYARASDKRVIVLEKNYHWDNVLNQYPEPLFVVEPASQGWKVYAVKDNPSTFINRKDLPLSWAGKRDAELAAVTGVSDAIFCHNKRFTAVAKSKEGALMLVNKALE